MDLSDTSAEKLILVVDDSQDAVLLLQRLLQLKGYAVHTCFDGRTGLEAAERLRPGGILLDLAMPDMDGFAVCQAIRTQPWGTHMLLIALSGYSSDVDRHRSQQAGFDLHLTKPVDFALLIRLLGERLA